MKRIGLFGFGFVAQGLYEALSRENVAAEIVKICIRNPNKSREIDVDFFTTDAREILDDSSIDVVIELIDDPVAAREIVFETLKRRIPTISANKKMIATHLKEIVQLQTLYGTPFLYEGAVAGSIPILQNIKKYYTSQKVKEVRAILNGSSNFILTTMKRDGVAYEAALEAAQVLGFAETDPFLDVQGYDAVYKTVIIGYHVFGRILKPEAIERDGIDQLSPYLLQQGRKEYTKVKLIATLNEGNHGVEASVKPEILSPDDPLYFVDDEYNAILIDGELSGPQLLVGKGAGSLPTGYAVYGDLKAILEEEIAV